MEIKFKGIILSELNNLPESKEKNAVLLNIKEVHKPSKKYGKNGFRFPNKWINEVPPNFIIQLPLEYIADYVYLEDKNKHDNNDEKIINGLRTFIKNRDLFHYFQQMKPSLLGSLAYGVLNVKDEYSVYSATKVLNMYFDWCFFAELNDINSIVKMVDEHKNWLLTLN